MTLFLLLAMPLLWVLSLALLNRDKENWYTHFPWLGYLKLFALGAAAFLLIVLLYLFLKAPMKEFFNSSFSYLGHVFFTYILSYLVLIGSYLLLKYLTAFFPDRESIFEFFTYGVGFYTMSSFFALVVYFRQYDGLVLFIFPLILWILLTITALVLENVLNESDFQRLLYIGMLVVLPFICGLLSFLYVLNFKLLADILVVLGAAGALAAFKYFYA